jgi:hypothetical protein
MVRSVKLRKAESSPALLTADLEGLGKLILVVNDGNMRREGFKGY